MKRTLCLWFPNWPLQRLGHVRPELKRRAVVLYEQQRGLKVVACSRLAARQGVAVGMSVADATTLAQIHLEQHDPAADRALLAEQAAECESFSPWVALENAAQPQCLFLDITGLAAIFGSEEALCQQATRILARRGYLVRSAVADTPGAAWAVAHYGEPRAGEPGLGQSGSRQPGSIVPPGQTLAALAPLPLAALRLSAETLTLLAELGLGTIADLLTLPRASLAARFAPELVERLDQATGALCETLPGHRPPPQITAARQFEYPLADRAALELVVGQLVDQIARSLLVRQQGALQLECELCCPPSEPVRLLVGLFQASAVASHLRELISMQLEQCKLPGPVESIRLSVLLLARLQNRQRELFDDPHDHERQLGLLIDRLSGRLRREAVVQAVLVPDAQPEYAYRYEPLAGSRSQRGIAARRKRTSHAPPQASGLKPQASILPERPLWLSAQPMPLAVAAVEPEELPLQFRLHGQPHRVARSWGPERIQTGWWRGRYLRRDYYRIETTCGERFWIFRSGRHWFLQGWFD